MELCRQSYFIHVQLFATLWTCSLPGSSVHGIFQARVLEWIAILKSRDITLPTKFHLVKAMVFPVVMYRCDSWDYKESWAPKNWCFWTVVLEKTLESPLDCKEIQPVHPKGDQSWIFPGGSDGKASVYNAGDPGSIPGSGRSPGEGNGNPLQYSCLENPMDRGAW